MMSRRLTLRCDQLTAGFSFEWIPYVFCVGTGAIKKDDREAMLQKAKSAGALTSFFHVSSGAR